MAFPDSPNRRALTPRDWLMAESTRRIEVADLDLDRDVWLYVSDRYLGQEAAAGETGSSTMPHKVNPIDFENSEGNLSKANSDLTFLADYVTTSRLQRDLSDSTVKRNVGSALAHCLIGYSKTTDGLAKVVPNEQVMREDLESTPEVVGEAVQTILRREGDTEAYERGNSTYLPRVVIPMLPERSSTSAMATTSATSLPCRVRRRPICVDREIISRRSRSRLSRAIAGRRGTQKETCSATRCTRLKSLKTPKSV